MRVLVTGSKGFVGQWLIRHLEANGDEPVGLDAEVDITDAPAIAKAITGAAPEAICHLAAQASVGVSWADPAATYMVNTVGAVNVLAAGHACDTRPRVLLVSSSEVYGRVRPGDLPTREEAPFAPVSPYAASKAAAELAGLQAWLGQGLEVVRARPFNHTGPGQRTDFVVPALAMQVAEAVASGADALYTGNLEPKRDITDVRDVVRAYRLLLERGEPGEAYNVCSGVSVTIRDVAERLLRIAGLDLPVVVDEDRVRPVEIPELRGDPSKLREATGWRPEIGLDQTLADVVGYWKRPAASAAGR
ncbi:MAG TPA: GDP-mannose 4,6-dehydratase [Acidimicrobiales bacterium]|nr:GDP-mannose 4,6-dehydratase [Acidimicrobiales bacterium]